MRTSKIKVGLISPCLGVGGADALTLGMVKYCHNLHFTGIAVHDHMFAEQMEWVDAMIGHKCPIHQRINAENQFALLGEGVNYHQHYATAIFEACRYADVIVSWGTKDLSGFLQNLRKPVIELAQNTDQFAIDVANDNKDVVTYRVACSEAAMIVYGDRPVDAVIYNGVDPGRCTPRFGRELTRQMWDIGPDKKILLFLGRFVDEKFPQAMIMALNSLPDNWVGMFVGKGYRDKDLFQEAQRYLGGNKIYFMQPQYHVGDIFDACDVFLLPTDFEGHPLAVCEAWLSGIPTVVTEIPVMQELRAKFGNLSTYIPRRPKAKALAEAILRAASDDPMVLEERARAREVSWNNFTLPTICCQWEDFINKCLYDWNRRLARPDVYMVPEQAPLQSAKATVKIVSHHG